MAKHISSRRRSVAEINVVPYIDVMLVLLVIFMITAPLLTQGVQVNLPQAQAKSLTSKDQEPLIISVDAQGLYYLNVSDNPARSMTPEQIATRVAAEMEISRERGQQRLVMVKGDRSVDYGKIITAMVLLQQAGAESVGLMTTSSEQKTI